MKNRDTKLYIAVLLLIGLVVLLLIVTINRNPNIKIQQLNKQIMQIKLELETRPIPKDGHTPVLGVDYFVHDGKDAPVYSPPKDGQNAVSTNTIKEVPVNGLSAYDLAIQLGFQGTQSQWLDSLKVKGDKGDSGAEYDWACINGRIVKKYTADFFGQPTNIKCETTDE